MARFCCRARSTHGDEPGQLVVQVPRLAEQHPPAPVRDQHQALRRVLHRLHLGPGAGKALTSSRAASRARWSTWSPRRSSRPVVSVTDHPLSGAARRAGRGCGGRPWSRRGGQGEALLVHQEGPARRAPGGDGDALHDVDLHRVRQAGDDLHAEHAGDGGQLAGDAVRVEQEDVVADHLGELGHPGDGLVRRGRPAADGDLLDAALGGGQHGQGEDEEGAGVGDGEPALAEPLHDPAPAGAAQGLLDAVARRRRGSRHRPGRWRPGPAIKGGPRAASPRRRGSRSPGAPRSLPRPAPGRGGSGRPRPPPAPGRG